MKSRLPIGYGSQKNAMAEKLQNVQRKMQERTAEIEQMTFSAQSGGGAVRAVVMGDKSLKSLDIKPDVVSGDDVEMLQDLIISAVNEAMSEVDTYTNSEIEKITQGLSVPGLI